VRRQSRYVGEGGGGGEEGGEKGAGCQWTTARPRWNGQTRPAQHLLRVRTRGSAAPPRSPTDAAAETTCSLGSRSLEGKGDG